MLAMRNFDVTSNKKNNVMHILTANVANSKNYKFIFMYYLLCFLPTLFTVLALNSTKRWLYMTNSIHFFYISREIWMPLICYNLMAFYLIWVGFSLKIIILIGEHCYADFCVKNKILNFSAKFFFFFFTSHCQSQACQHHY